jgi:hypothetical protein
MTDQPAHPSLSGLEQHGGSAEGDQLQRLLGELVDLLSTNPLALAQKVMDSQL